MGPLLADMSTKMQTKASRGDKDPLKVLVYSTHDSALAALCGTFDVFDEKYDVLVQFVVMIPDVYSKVATIHIFSHVRTLQERALRPRAKMAKWIVGRTFER